MLEILTLSGKDHIGVVLGVTRVVGLSELLNIYSKASMTLHSAGSFQTFLVFSVALQIFFLHFIINYSQTWPIVLPGHLK